jgi:hypothetical protein
VSENHPLTDNDLEASFADRIVEGSVNRAHGEHILSMVNDANKSRDEATHSLLDAITQARLAKLQDGAKHGGDDAA